MRFIGYEPLCDAGQFVGPTLARQMVYEARLKICRMLNKMGKLPLNSITLLQNQMVSDAIKCIDASGGQIALVADAYGALVGTVTDGDVRRGLLKGLALDSPVHQIMNSERRVVPSRHTH